MAKAKTNTLEQPKADPKFVTVKFIKSFEGNYNNFPIVAKKHQKLKLPIAVYKWIQKHDACVESTAD
jgi:cytoplasmic iron level regulating protein YaaA (DUF328/UPF0246 family)